MISVVYSTIAAYLLGAIPFSYILGRAVKGIDIRSMGSGNVGATNLMRCGGKTLGITALIMDIAKGIVAVTVAADFFYTPSMALNLPAFRVMLGLCVVTGHTWTVFLNFKGGKGVATTIGVLIGLSPAVAMAGLLVWCLFAAAFRYVSLASMAMGISLPVFMFIFAETREYVVLTIALCIIIICRHHSNIYRIIKGIEHKIGRK